MQLSQPKNVVKVAQSFCRVTFIELVPHHSLYPTPVCKTIIIAGPSRMRCVFDASLTCRIIGAQELSERMRNHKIVDVTAYESIV